MTNENDPKPGTPAYDLMMAERYRGQKDGPQERGERSDAYDHIRNDDGSVRLSIRRDSTIGPAHAPESYTREQADPAQVVALEREVERIHAELEEVDRYDPRSGEPVHRYQGEARRAREIRLEHLERVELPVVREVQQRAAAWREANVPTALQTLSEEKARRETLRERAEQIADEQEAQALAARVLAQRRGAK